MTLQQFIATWSGKFIPSRGGITGQCVSMVQKWAEDNGVTGTPVFPVAAAKDMPGTRKDFFDWIPNTPTGVPQAGDIVVWGNQVGQYGHTAIFIDGNAQSFRSFDQNWPVGTAAHIQQHNYNGVLGWLRFKKPNQGVVMDTADGQWVYQSVLRRPAENTSASSAGQWNGLKPEVALRRAYESPESQAIDAKLKNYDVLVEQLKNSKTKAEYEAVAAQAKVSAEKVAELEKKAQELEKQVKENPDTVLIDEGKNWLQKLIARFTGGK